MRFSEENESVCDRQASPDRKAKEVTCWLVQAYDELLEGWDSTEGESYSERYHVRVWTAVFTFSTIKSPFQCAKHLYTILFMFMSQTRTGVASTHDVLLPPSGAAHLFGVLQRAAASHHASADGNETKPEADGGAADAQGGLGRPHC